MANRGGSRMSSKAPLAPDRSVVTEIAQGDIEALGELMRRHGRTVYALAYSILVDPGEADDVVVETFEQARDRKSTRLNSSHSQISYAVFCLKKKKKKR